MNLELNYGELAKDKDFVTNCEDLKENLIEVQNVLNQLLPLKKQYDKMPLQSQIELDLFLAYTLNSLHWIKLRLQGIDPTKHPIKDQLQRIRATMVRWQEVKDRDKRPKVNVEAAKRFVRSGLYDPKKSEQPQNKKIRFEDSD